VRTAYSNWGDAEQRHLSTTFLIWQVRTAYSNWGDAEHTEHVYECADPTTPSAGAACCKEDQVLGQPQYAALGSCNYLHERMAFASAADMCARDSSPYYSTRTRYDHLPGSFANPSVCLDFRYLHFWHRPESEAGADGAANTACYSSSIHDGNRRMWTARPCAAAQVQVAEAGT
jgi:hypothetical protein